MGSSRIINMYLRDNGPMTFLNSEVTTEGKNLKLHKTTLYALRRLKSEKMTDDWSKYHLVRLRPRVS